MSSVYNIIRARAGSIAGLFILLMFLIITMAFERQSVTLDIMYSPLLVVKREGLSTVERSLLIDAPAEKVWNIISSPGYLEKVHPFVESNVAKQWPGKGSMDQIVYDNGVTLDRHLYAWFEGRGYDLEIGNIGEEVNSHVRWRVEAIDGNTSKISIAITPYKPFGPRFIYWLAMKVYFESNLGSYLDSVVKGIRHYAESDQPVTQDQFGRVSGFSG